MHVSLGLVNIKTFSSDLARPRLSNNVTMEREHALEATVQCEAHFEYPSYVAGIAQKVLCVTSVRAEAHVGTRLPVDVCAVIDR